MNVYIQQKYSDKDVFGPYYTGQKDAAFIWDLIINSFDQLPATSSDIGLKKLKEFIKNRDIGDQPGKEEKIDSFQPIIDFSNFLLIVLKLCRMEVSNFNYAYFNLDDKELINEFDKAGDIDEAFVKKFGFNLLNSCSTTTWSTIQMKMM